MIEPLAVRLCIKDGPVLLRSAAELGVNCSMELWDGIVVSEYYPPRVSSAFYVVEVRKLAHSAREVRSIEQELSDALFMIAAAWSFSGGSLLPLESRRLISSTRVESNADEVGHALSMQEGTVHAASEGRMPIETLSTYSRAPLALAVGISKHMRNHLPTRKILEYHQESHVRGPRLDPAAWFIALYKVRDLLDKFYKAKKKQARSELSIPLSAWKKFGDLLNNGDRRHAELAGIVPPISNEDLIWLYATAREWVKAFLIAQGFSVV
jgi:hypothetical protein